MDDLLAALDLEALGGDRFQAGSERSRHTDRVFGGQLLAQALTAAGLTAPGLAARSMQAVFVRPGVPDRPMELQVERVRDGRSIATRHVTLSQGGRVLLTATASFHEGVEPAEPADGGPSDDVPTLHHWAEQSLRAGNPYAANWRDAPPPLEIRIAEPLTFLGGSPAAGARTHWMRAAFEIGDDPLRQSALLAYASDLFLMDIVFRSWPGGHGRLGGFSVDHCIWFHRPSRFEHWHAHTQDSLANAGDRGLAHGTITDAGGAMIATVMQDVLVRPLEAS